MPIIAHAACLSLLIRSFLLLCTLPLLRWRLWSLKLVLKLRNQFVRVVQLLEITNLRHELLASPRTLSRLL